MVTKKQSLYDKETQLILSQLLQKAISKENIGQQTVAKHLGFAPYYVSWIWTGNLDRVPDKIWKRVEEWVDSKLSLARANYPEVPKAFRIKKKEEPTSTKSLSSMDDIVDKILEGVILAQKYGVPPENWKAFVKDVVIKK